MKGTTDVTCRFAVHESKCSLERDVCDGEYCDEYQKRAIMDGW